MIKSCDHELRMRQAARNVYLSSRLDSALWKLTNVKGIINEYVMNIVNILNILHSNILSKKDCRRMLYEINQILRMDDFQN